MKLIEKKSTTIPVIAHEVPPVDINMDESRYARIGWVVVLVGVVGFLLWAFMAPLDKGVPMSGVVAKETNRKQIQHLSGGTIDEILVKDGDFVKKGQVLVRMNTVQAKAEADMARVQYYTARATQARLLAERDGKPAPEFAADLLAKKSDPELVNVLEVQKQLFQSRRGSLQSELAANEENIAGLKIQIGATQEARESKKLQLSLMKEQLDGMRDLSKDGYVARNRLLDLERNYAQISGAIAEDGGTIGRAQRQVAELTLRRAQRLQDYQKEVRTQLSDAQKEAEALEARTHLQEFQLQRTEIVAPVDGTIVNLNIFTRGGVVTPGFRLMDIVPASDPFIVEGQLPNNLVDKVHPGLKVDLIFSAFNANKTPHIPGEVIMVSADSTVNEHTGAAYYKVHARVSQEGLKIIAQHKMDIQPGMPVEMFVKTGERTMMNYLLKPVIDRAGTALSEE